MRFKSQLMTTEEVMRALKRIAHQIAERNNGVRDVVIVGILRGGMPLARQLADYLMAIEGIRVPVGALDISAHRDDRRRGAETPEEPAPEAGDEEPAAGAETDLPFAVEDRNVVLVDDVLYTGRTARAAFDALSDYGRARTIQLAVLIDRGHRELPIRADYVGKNIPTSHTELIGVDFDENGAMPVVNIYDL
ncbi:MAG: bifunctional pyr operon transcriptional regulator/uracil phosphoribosyltransferase PyrR [Clostridia bacterium]|nr:bifunctional pyr operon transcriptional regulator/uracil phosphoribosyltransferase PyrR [Clostridia bacterium]